MLPVETLYPTIATTAGWGGLEPIDDLCRNGHVDAKP